MRTGNSSVRQKAVQKKRHLRENPPEKHREPPSNEEQTINDTAVGKDAYTMNNIVKTLMKVSYGVYIISAKDENGKKAGCVVNTICQATAQHPYLTVCVSKENLTHDVMKAAGKFGFSILSEATSPKTIGLFGFQSSRDVDKFAQVSYTEQEDVPIVEDHICGWAVCTIIQAIDADTHTVFLAEVTAADEMPAAAPPMTYDYYHRVVKGKAPRTAPTYVEESAEDAAAKANESWVCTVCGYVYEGDLTQEPDDYECPLCGVGKSMFEKQQ